MMKHSHTYTKQQGVVIIVALFIVALVAAISYYMMGRLERDTRRTQLLLRHVQAEFFAVGSIDWAIDQLKNNGERIPPRDQLPLASPVDEQDGFHIASILNDAQNKFNINSLKFPEKHRPFKRLLQTVLPDVKEDELNQLIRAMVDWIAPGNQQSEFQKYYLSLKPPYRQANRPIISIYELANVKGMTTHYLTALAPYITALPQEQLPINPRTASPPVLMTLSPIMTLASARVLQETLKHDKEMTIEKFLALEIVKNNNIEASGVTFNSQFFTVETHVDNEDQHFTLFTLVERIMEGQKARFKTHWQSQNASP